MLWYVFGIHHITRPEDWPVMPVDTVSFWLKPVGFFDRNPALDVPPAHPPLPSRGEPDDHRDLSNFIHGERVAAADGRTSDIVDPSTGEAYATAPLSGDGGHRRRVPGRRARVRGAGATRRRASASARCCGSPTRSRSAPSELVDDRVRRTPASRKELTHERGDPADGATRSASSRAPRASLEGRSAGEYMRGFTSFIRREPVGVVRAR